MRSRLLRVRDLTPEDRRRMFELISRSFHGVTRERFAADLEEKNRVVLLEGESGRLRGFSTLLFYRAWTGGERANVVYSGDTIIDPDSWHASLLAPAWINAVRRLHRERPAPRLLWLLITSGYRTYRFLPVFCRRFHPRHDRPTPPAVARQTTELARERFGSRYDPASGIVRFAQPQVLVEKLRGIPAGRLANPHVAFFERVNPGHEAGDELVCLTSLDDDNLTRAGRRMLARGRKLCRLEVAA